MTITIDDLELALLGSIVHLSSKGQAAQATTFKSAFSYEQAWLPTEVMYQSINRALFDVMLELINAGQLCTFETLQQTLNNRQLFDEVGGFSALNKLSKLGASYPSPKSIKSLAGQVKEEYYSRELSKLGLLINDLSTSGHSVEAIATVLRSKLDSLAPSQVVDTTPKRKEIDLLQYLPPCWFKDHIQQISRLADFPAASVFLATIGCVSALACRRYATTFESGGRIPLSLYIAVGQPPSTAKSRVLSLAMGKVNQWQRNIVLDYRKNLESWQSKPPKDRSEPPTKPPVIFATDVTPEAIDQALNDGNGYFSLASSEQALANTLLGASYGAGTGKKNNNDLLLKGFNAEWHASSRTSRNGYIGVVVGSVVCLTQDAVIRTIIEQSDGSGVAERFILLAEANRLGQRNHLEKKPAFSQYQGRYDTLLNSLLGAGNFSGYDDLPTLRPSEKAYKLITDCKQEYEPLIKDGGVYASDMMRGTVGKLDQQVLKIAGLLALIDGHTDTTQPYDDVWVRAALQIVIDLIHNTYELIQSFGFAGDDACESEIVDFMSSKGRAVTRTEIKQAKHKAAVFRTAGDSTPSNAIDAAIDRLMLKRILVEELEQNATRGYAKKLRLIR